MENAKPHRKASFIIGWGVVWGGLMTLLIEVMDWYPNRHLDPLSHILVRLGINIALAYWAPLCGIDWRRSVARN